MKQFTRRDLLKNLACAAAGCPFLLAGVKKINAYETSMHRALFWEDAGNKRIKCLLCPRECIVADRERGTCGVRENKNGVYYTLVHSRPCSLHSDPIEKKPLFHYMPGTNAFSIATAGCNIECKFCQNWEISQFRPEQIPSRDFSPHDVVKSARQKGAKSIAFTYSEPVIFYEYMEDICLAARETGIGRAMISNGYIQKKPLLRLLKNMDAVKIDFKAFTQSFYKDICSANLRPVLESLITIKKSGTWLELVMLVIPTLNDNPRELKAMSKWIVQNLGTDVPVHFTRFHPMYKITNLPPTPVSTLKRCRKIAMAEGIKFAYTGNVPGNPGENTYCPSCKKALIRRSGYYIIENAIKNGYCPSCNTRIPGIWK